MSKHHKSSKKQKKPSKSANLVPDSVGLTPQVINKKQYEKELEKLQVELVKLQEWVQASGQRVVVIFEGRDTAGKGGSIRRIAEALNPRYCRVVALGVPSDRERSQWYFQRYVNQLPSAGEILLFDRSWYNRAGVEKVMGFCSEAEYEEFLFTCPQIERALVRSGIQVIKYWLSISDEEQERRFRARMTDPVKQWKLSPMDLEARAHWVDYAEAKDEMLLHTDIAEAPWFVVDAEDKKTARLNLISHLLSQIPYEDLPTQEFVLSDRQKRAYQRPPIEDQNWVPKRFIVA
ncbi:polyphosphate kinase 2, PA0141 family [Actinobacteria bacterium IMCC26207]|nr:polyphosphate kinase 2, PA0141 family [Actinobacteria bacterium IMCC26207]